MLAFPVTVAARLKEVLKQGAIQKPWKFNPDQLAGVVKW